MPLMRINVGPIHPSTHGVLRLIVDIDGDTIKNVEPHIGFLHRGVEKLSETRTYLQNISYYNKLDYVSPLSWEDLYVSTVEKAMDIEVKEAAMYVRVILLEFQRIANHLLWLGTFCNDMGQMFTEFMWTFRERERILQFFEHVTGQRMFFNYMRLGGVRSPLPPDFKEEANDLIDYLYKNISDYTKVLDANSIFKERLKGIGILSYDDAIKYGVSGPVLRASGVNEDVRKSYPYYIYNKIEFYIPLKTEGDSYARYQVRYEEMFQSIKIIRDALMKMPDDDVVGIPVKLINPPAKNDTVIERRELPKGEGLLYMVPDKQKPYRISIRAPAFANLQVLPLLAKDIKYADLFPLLGSLDLVMAEIDR
jgi:NADH-quinone oxidoreductase subunit D